VLFDRRVLANDKVRIVGTSGGIYHPAGDVVPPGGEGFIHGVRVQVNLDARPPIETYTFTFLDSTTFRCNGSVSGFQGEGIITETFTTLNGGLTLLRVGLSIPWNMTLHTYAAGQRVTLTLGWSSSLLPNLGDPPVGTRPILDIWREFMLSSQGGQLSASDLDSSVNDFEPLVNNQDANPFVVDAPATALDVIDDLSFHLGAVAFEKANAKIGLFRINPRIVPAGSIEPLCHSDDLVSAETDHLPIYNQFTMVYDYDVASQNFLSTTIFPASDEPNESEERYGRLYPAPRNFEFRSYSTSISGNDSWISLLALILYRRYQDPGLTVKASLKFQRLSAELDDLYSLASMVPTMDVIAMEVFSLAKQLTGDILVEAELIDVTAIIQEEGACGWLSYDTPGQGYDQCWGYF
jgi:hypothetical protein